MHLTPTWLLRALTLLLAAVFALPACTLILWQDDRSLDATRIECAELRAFRDPTSPTALFLQLPPAAVQQLRQFAPELPAELDWIRLAATNKALADQLDAASRDEDPVTLYVTLFRDTPEAAPFWAVEPYRFHNYFGKPKWGERHAAAAATATVLAAPPATGAPLPSLHLDYATCDDDGTPVLTRIALTPLALLGDTVLVGLTVVAVAVMIPLAPIAWLVHELGGDDTK